jgi:D-alanine-D-alanine ligase
LNLREVSLSNQNTKILMKLAYLYTESELTPWKENVNAATLAFLLSQTPLEIKADIVHFDGFNEDMLEKLKRYDLIFNLCYGYKDAGQTEVAGWLQHYGIKHSASSFEALKLAQDKSILPDLCGQLDILTPEVFFETTCLDDEVLYLSKPRKGSCHRNIQIGKGAWMKTHLNTSGDDLIFQPYIFGREFSVAVIPVSGGKYYHALPPVEIVPTAHEDIYIAGQSLVKTKREFCPNLPDFITDDLMEAAEKLHKRIGLSGMSRTDFRVDKNGDIYTLDVNAMPNMDPERSLLPAICQYNGVAIMDLIKRIIDNSDYVSACKTQKSRKNIHTVSI